MGLSKDAIISKFRKSWEEIKNNLLFFDTPLVKNDYEADLNIIYFNMEYSRWGDTWKYDLAYSWDWIKLKSDIWKKFKQTNKFKTSILWIYDYNNDTNQYDWNVPFNWEELNLWEISNVLTALNAYRLWFSQDHLEYWAMKTVEYWGWNWVEWELADRVLYDYWYKLWEIEEKNWKLTDDEIMKYVKDATIARKNYLNNK
jgi:hypothetical protein